MIKTSVCISRHQWPEDGNTGRPRFFRSNIFIPFNPFLIDRFYVGNKKTAGRKYISLLVPANQKVPPLVFNQKEKTEVTNFLAFVGKPKCSRRQSNKSTIEELGAGKTFISRSEKNSALSFSC